MARAVVDTTVLFAAAYRRDSNHERCLDILRGIDGGTLPEVVVLDYVLAETMNGLTRKATHNGATDFLDRLEANQQFVFDRLTDGQVTHAKSLFREYPRLSLVDAAITAYIDATSHQYLYSLNDDFDGVDGLERLDSTRNPFEP